MNLISHNTKLLWCEFSICLCCLPRIYYNHSHCIHKHNSVKWSMTRTLLGIIKWKTFFCITHVWFCEAKLRPFIKSQESGKWKKRTGSELLNYIQFLKFSGDKNIIFQSLGMLYTYKSRQDLKTKSLLYISLPSLFFHKRKIYKCYSDRQCCLI